MLGHSCFSGPKSPKSRWDTLSWEDLEGDVVVFFLGVFDMLVLKGGES